MKKESLNVFESIQGDNFKVLGTERLQQIKGGKGKGRDIGDDVIWDIIDS